MNYASKKWYAWENENYAAAYGIPLLQQDAKRMAKKIWKLAKKIDLQTQPYSFIFKKPPKMVFKNMRGGLAHMTYVHLPLNPPLGLLIHELCHCLHDQSFLRDTLQKIPNKGSEAHGLHYEIILNRVHQALKETNYFEKQRQQWMAKRLPALPALPAIKTLAVA